MIDIKRCKCTDSDEEKRQGDDQVTDKSELVRSSLGFVYKIAREYAGLGLPFEDLLAEGNLGLIEAANRYDPCKGAKFTTYAVWWIRKSITSALGLSAGLVRVPQAQVRKLRQISEAEGDLRASLKRQPTRAEISDRLSTREHSVDFTLRHRAGVTSLDQEVGESGTATLHDIMGDTSRPTPEECLIEIEWRRLLRESLAELPERERFVLERRFGLHGDDKSTLKDLGQHLGLSRERVRQIERKAGQRLRQRILARRAPCCG
jgi:RNA polymerase primary sigma factor